MASNNFVFLTQDFYNKYPASEFPQMEQKLNRPYVQVLVKANGLLFAIPLRSNIQHPHAFWTDKQNHCGVDLSKAVLIKDPNTEIDLVSSPYIRPNEYKKLVGKTYRIEKKMEEYIQTYKHAKKDPSKRINKMILDFSTLQYFEDDIL